MVRLPGEYDPSRVHIATLCSHTSLQIFHGAKQEGFRTVGIVELRRKRFYEHFKHLIDELIVVRSWRDLCSDEVVNTLIELNSVIIPHGSIVEYVGLDCCSRIPTPMFGLRSLLEVEANQHMKMKLLRKAGIPTPKEYRVGDEVDRVVIVKLPGAKGGRGYFIASSTPEILRRVDELVSRGVVGDANEVLIQEFVIGVPAYFHFFYSPILGRIELLGMDIRYESNVDGIRRLPIELSRGVSPTFNVIGNVPLVLRESLLATVMEYGMSFVKTTQDELPPGIIGPFCLESIITDNGDIIVFEFSGRIVAGTNLYINGSPYSWLYWNEPMSMGRRIARELRMALELGRLASVVT